jgi:cytoplasmic iron level regulating protein YaaA (DUF328/UPF0246 family)
MMPAYQRYDGNLYRKIARDLWPVADRDGSARILIVSALYGLLTPAEPIRYYNRTMSEAVHLRCSLARWWAERGLGELLLEYVRGTGTTTVDDFLSGAYSVFAGALSKLQGSVKVHHHSYPGLGSGADHHRGWDVSSLLVRGRRRDN